MNPPPPLENVRWPASRWLALGALILALHLCLLFSLGEYGKPLARRASIGPFFSLAGDVADEWMELNNPTLFTLAPRHSFSQRAWMEGNPVEFQTVDWSEPPRWLTLQSDSLGKTFAQIKASSEPTPFVTARKIEADVTPVVTAADRSAAEKSSVHIEGELAQREWINAAEPPSIPIADVLQPTITHVTVDASGFVLSAVPIASSGLKEADAQALAIAQDARFAPLNRMDGLSSGRLIFNWHTVLPPTSSNTNATPH